MFYQALIYIYNSAIFLSSKFGNEKAKKWIDGRKNWRQNIEKLPKYSTLFHCASLGEFDQAVPVIQAWRKKF
ncbi:MAG: glycosyltransferase N-terminal domain-containing protein, partial [Crocinitomicaceae bacterium]